MALRMDQILKSRGWKWARKWAWKWSLFLVPLVLGPGHCPACLIWLVCLSDSSHGLPVKLEDLDDLQVAHARVKEAASHLNLGVLIQAFGNGDDTGTVAWEVFQCHFEMCLSQNNCLKLPQLHQDQHLWVPGDRTVVLGIYFSPFIEVDLRYALSDFVAKWCILKLWLRWTFYIFGGTFKFPSVHLLFWIICGALNLEHTVYFLTF